MEPSSLEENMTQNYANNRVVNELLMPLKKRSGAMIGWGIFCIVLGTIGLFAPIAGVIFAILQVWLYTGLLWAGS